MKLMPRNYGLSLFDDVFGDVFTGFSKNEIMKTDIQEKEGQYLLDMELPEYSKEDITLELQDGYLKVKAIKNEQNEEKDAKGNILRQERYSGSCSRSFYVGDALSEEDIKANYNNGELKICFKKTDPMQVQQKKTIAIE